MALYDYEGGSGSLPLKAGMRMMLIKYSEAGDWAYVSINGKKTWEPASYLEVQKSPSSVEKSVEKPVERTMLNPVEKPSPRLSVSSTKSTPAPMPVSSGLLKRAVVIADFEGEESVEMSVRKGEVISVLKRDADWLLGEVGSRVGCEGRVMRVEGMGPCFVRSVPLVYFGWLFVWMCNWIMSLRTHFIQRELPPSYTSHRSHFTRIPCSPVEFQKSNEIVSSENSADFAF